MGAAAVTTVPHSRAGGDEDGERTRVLIVDDHRIFAEAMALALAAEPDMECVGKAHTVRTALSMARALKPDLVIMDVRLGDGDGVAATAELTKELPDLRVVVLTAFADATLLQRADVAGACALLHKDGELAEMLAALRAVMSGDEVVHPQALVPVPEGMRPTQVAPTLDIGQERLLRLLVAGLDAAVIARELGVPVRVCQEEIKVLLAKLGAESELDALVIAMRHGLIRAGAAE